MPLSIGIVGLPNVGKSTLFNALSTAKAEAANYPFCTIEPNVGVVIVPDERLEKIDSVTHAEKVIPTVINFVDIAGLVRGASKGEGLGNQFLSHIREADAIVQVGRCFEDANVIHVENKIDPVADIAIVTTELCLKDLDTVNKRADRARKAAKGNDPKEKIAAVICEDLAKHLNDGKPARTMISGPGKASWWDNNDAQVVVREMHLLTAKPAFYIGNIDEATIANLSANKHFAALSELATQEGTFAVPVCAALEAQIAELDPKERPDFLESAGLKEPGLFSIIRAGYKLLGLLTFFTAGKAEVRAWTTKIGAKAPQAAGVIHTDFEKNFIKAEVIWWEDLIALGTEAKCRDAGKLAIEGKEYVMRDGDVVHFRHSG